MIKNPFKLEKLKIRAYSSRKRGLPNAVGSFEAMFNPQTFSQTFEITYGKDQGYNSTNKKVNYSRSKPSVLKLLFIVDGTGVNSTGIKLPGMEKSVAKRVKEFLDLTFRMNGKIHEPNFLVIEWGELIFSCRLGSVDIKYTTFDRDGSALRAELDATFVSDVEVKKRMALENKSSPDLTHHRVVRDGDSLLSLTKQIYGSADYYLFVAEANLLDAFRDLRPGQELVFPPLPTVEPATSD